MSEDSVTDFKKELRTQWVGRVLMYCGGVGWGECSGRLRERYTPVLRAFIPLSG